MLEVGCGTGRNLILAARRYPHAKLFGFDISPAMLETAAALDCAGGPVAIASRWRRAMRPNFSGRRCSALPNFDRVFISYALSMIPPWREALAQAFARGRAGRLAAHRRFRRAERAAGAGSASVLGRGSRNSPSSRAKASSAS